MGMWMWKKSLNIMISSRNFAMNYWLVVSTPLKILVIWGDYSIFPNHHQMRKVPLPCLMIASLLAHLQIGGGAQQVVRPLFGTWKRKKKKQGGTFPVINPIKLCKPEGIGVLNPLYGAPPWRQPWRHSSDDDWWCLMVETKSRVDLRGEISCHF